MVRLLYLDGQSMTIGLLYLAPANCDGQIVVSCPGKLWRLDCCGLATHWCTHTLNRSLGKTALLLIVSGVWIFFFFFFFKWKKWKKWKKKKKKCRRKKERKKLVACCLTSTETVGFLGTEAQDGHVDFHTAPELWKKEKKKKRKKRERTKKSRSLPHFRQHAQVTQTSYISDCLHRGSQWTAGQSSVPPVLSGCATCLNPPWLPQSQAQPWLPVLSYRTKATQQSSNWDIYGQQKK